MTSRAAAKRAMDRGNADTGTPAFTLSGNETPGCRKNLGWNLASAVRGCQDACRGLTDRHPLSILEVSVRAGEPRSRTSASPFAASEDGLEMPSSTDRPGRHGRLRVGLIGCGNVALSDHVPAYLSLPDRYELMAIADPTPARLELGGERERAGTGRSPRRCGIAARPIGPRSHRRLHPAASPSRSRHRGRGQRATCAVREAAGHDAARRLGDGRGGRSGGHDLAIMHNYLFFTEVARTLELIAAGEIGPVEVAILNWLAVLDNPATRPTGRPWRHDSRQAGGGVLMDMLHIVYVAEAMLGAPIERVSAWVTARSDDAPVEDIALARFETSTNAALVNVGWGVGMGGFGVSGPLGRIEVTYEDGGNGAFAPNERLVVHGRSGRAEVTGLPFEDGVRPLIADLADAIRAGRPPIATGAQGAHILEATLAVYASARDRADVAAAARPGRADLRARRRRPVRAGARPDQPDPRQADLWHQLIAGARMDLCLYTDSVDKLTLRSGTRPGRGDGLRGRRDRRRWAVLGAAHADRRPAAGRGQAARLRRCVRQSRAQDRRAELLGLAAPSGQGTGRCRAHQEGRFGWRPSSASTRS